MRTIPSELLDRVKKKWQVPTGNAGPAMKVYLSRGFINELFQVFTIQEGAELTDVDVTVKRTDTSAEPAEAFALAINDGVAQVKSKPLPYDDQIPWVDRMTVALSATAVAIEFDGYWNRDYATRRFNFVTEEYPWLFYVQGGTLFAKYWEDAEITLATDVVKVCAIRGWLPANGDQSNDQGLIVAYIKTDGLVYYRSYCIQVGGGKLWEVERNVVEILTACTDLALFRTNDFRIGFLVTIGGVVYWLLTERNYAGMSVWPDMLTGQFNMSSIDLIDIEYIDQSAPDEYLTGTFETLCVGLNIESDAAATCLTAEATLPSTITLTFSQNVTGSISRLKDRIIMTNAAGTIIYQIESVSIGTTQNKLVIVSSDEFNIESNVKITVGEAMVYCKTASGGMYPVAPFVIEASLIFDPRPEENLTGKFNMTAVTLTEIFYSSTEPAEESLTGQFNMTKIDYIKVGGGDI